MCSELFTIGLDNITYYVDQGDISLAAKLIPDPFIPPNWYLLLTPLSP